MAKTKNSKKPTTRNKTTNEKGRKKPKTNNGNTVTTVADDEQTVGNSVISAVTPAPTYPFVEAFVMRILNRKDPVTELVREFRDEKRGNDFTKMTAFTANMEKNRYKDVGCLDNNRVALTIGPSTYIHGNFVSGGTDPKKFICTQAPLPTTIEDFWSMVLQEGCRCIVMLCNYMEKNVKKCAEYLPKSLAQPLILPTMKITMLATGPFKFQSMTATKIQKTDVEVAMGDRRLQVSHLHWIDWPDRGVPPADMAPIEVVRDIQKYQGSPVVVHCSAGIGRTGSFVLLDMLFMQYQNGVKWAADMRPAMLELRKQRNNSVQTEHQYLYVHQVMLNFLRKENVLRDGRLLKKHDTFTEEYDKTCKGF